MAWDKTVKGKAEYACVDKVKAGQQFHIPRNMLKLYKTQFALKFYKTLFISINSSIAQLIRVKLLFGICNCPPFLKMSINPLITR